MKMDTDTIAAIATPLGEGGISVIRVSGPEAVSIVDRVYRGKHSLSTVDSHTIHYGTIVDPDSERTVDEVLVSVMRAPRTFTKEDVVEVNTHGGIVLVQKVLQILLDARGTFGGARRVYQTCFFKRKNRFVAGGSCDRSDSFQIGPRDECGDAAG